MPMLFNRLIKFGAPLATLALSGNLLLGQAKEDKIVELDPFTLTATKAKGYGATDSMGGTRINLPINDVPITIAVINREFMDDIAAGDSLEALRWVAGLGPAAGITSGAYSLRGQLPRGNSTNVIDGLPGGGFLTHNFHESEFIDRWEVIKGPAGTLYGDHDVGGLVNRVYKQPLRTRQTSIKSFVGSIGSTWQTALDHTGPIDKDGQLAYRLVGVIRDGETHTGGGDEKTALYGTISYNPKNSRSKFWARYQYQDIKVGHETASGFVDGAGRSSLDILGRIRTIPTINNEEYTLRYSEFGASTGTSGLLGDWDFRVVARFTDNSLHSKEPQVVPTAYTFVRADGSILGAIGTAVNATQPKFTDSWADIKLSNLVARISGPADTETRGIFLDLTGKFATGPLDHRMIVYAQSTSEKTRSDFLNMTLRPEFGGSSGSGNLNLANAYSVVRRQFQLPAGFGAFIVPAAGVSTSSSSSGERFNAGLQDNIYLWDKRLLLVGGARYDYIQNNGILNRITRVQSGRQTLSSVVTKAALVVKPFENRGVSIFANHSETFEPARTGETIVGSGIPFKNLEGTGKEVGLKIELMDARLIATAAYFKAEITNLIVFHLNPLTGLNEAVQDGVSPSKGWDLDLSWAFDKNWTGLIGLADVDSKTNTGLRLRGVQNDFNYKGLIRYTASPGIFKGLSGGLGVNYVAERSGDAPNTFVVPGFSTYDGFVTYARSNWRYQINVNNLTNSKAFVGMIFQSVLFSNNPREVRVSAEYRF